MVKHETFALINCVYMLFIPCFILGLHHREGNNTISIAWLLKNYDSEKNQCLTMMILIHGSLNLGNHEHMKPLRQSIVCYHHVLSFIRF